MGRSGWGIASAQSCSKGEPRSAPGTPISPAGGLDGCPWTSTSDDLHNNRNRRTSDDLHNNRNRRTSDDLHNNRNRRTSDDLHHDGNRRTGEPA